MMRYIILPYNCSRIYSVHGMIHDSMNRSNQGIGELAFSQDKALGSGSPLVGWDACGDVIATHAPCGVSALARPRAPHIRR
eukprot:COSAG02_NODE_32598_length_513_cov_6.787440_1_plen_80_part_10